MYIWNLSKCACDCDEDYDIFADDLVVTCNEIIDISESVSINSSSRINY